MYEECEVHLEEHWKVDKGDIGIKQIWENSHFKDILINIGIIKGEFDFDIEREGKSGFDEIKIEKKINDFVKNRNEILKLEDKLEKIENSLSILE